MQKWLLIVESHCADPARESEFRDWYDNVHFKDILKTKGFLKATRYEVQQVTKGDKDKVLAVYEIEADDVDAVMARHGENMKRAAEQGRMNDLIVTTARAIYKQAKVHQEQIHNKEAS